MAIHSISSSDMPQGDSVSFHSSAFFQRSPPCPFPSPSEVKKRGILVNKTHPEEWRPPPVHYPSLGLLVKYGGAASIEEGQALWMIRRYLGHVVPVPEIYGWRKLGTETFLYMQRISGSTLEERWKHLSKKEKLDLCGQIRPMVRGLRDLKQKSPKGWVGKDTPRLFTLLVCVA